ncbi:hypothetical protein A0J61_04018 [Choanephora cucurbitarum]|uniref:Uncharacterized protein n=1 Tax=Choanephora cucurbitarum TaxID=101091 RepID=A0A1C7NFR0_9FUNG|nr:hypothetical protein A0J61_04018 [Choanephora cucurbitarum]
MSNRQDSELPGHVPVDMALAPDRKPYNHTHVIHTPHVQSDHKVAQHSLSPEKLGLVGYVKDVAGFVKDVMHEQREKKQLARRSSTTSIEEQQQQERRRSSDVSTSMSMDAVQPTAIASSAPTSPTPLAGAVSALFPGVSETNVVNCTHADDLRNQMMHANDHEHQKLL